MIHHFQELLHSMESLPSSQIAFQWEESDSGEIRQKSYPEFVKDIRCCVSKLKSEFGEIKDKHIALLAQNQYLYPVYLFAAMLSQAIVCPLNFMKTPEEISYELEKAEIEFLVHDGTFFDREKGFEQGLSCITMRMEEASTYSEDTSESEPDVNALAMILFTSGTTGKSKGVMINQKAIFNSTYHHTVLLSSVKDADDHSEMTMLPFYHVGGLHTLVFNAIYGDQMVLCNDPKNFISTLKRFSITRCYMVPMVLKSFCRLVKRNQTHIIKDLKSIYTGASMVDPGMIDFLIENHFQVTCFYGMTESFACGTRNFCHLCGHTDSIGLPDPTVEIKIVDNELLLRTPSVMMGYYHDPDLTQSTIDSEGWLYTGDLARMDEEGYYYIIGRKKNLIILSNGENVSPELLESRLYLNKDITEVMVKEANDLICAEIFCEEKAQDSIQNYIDQLNVKLPLYQQIARVEFRNTPFERTATGKIKRGASV